MQQTAGPSLLSRVIAILVLVVAAWVLFDLVLGFVTWLAGIVALVVAVVAAVWALRVLL
jgi:accessory gene regulator protein AgrB